MSIGVVLGDASRSDAAVAHSFTYRLRATAVMLDTMKFLRSAGIDGWGGKLRGPAGGYVLALLVLLGSLMLVLLYWRGAQQRELQLAETEFVAETATITELLQQRLINYELIARGGVSLFASVDRPSAAQWQDYVDGLKIATYYPDMLGLGYAPYLDRPQLQTLQLGLRDEGRGFYIVRPAGIREHYGPILYMEPAVAANQGVIGFDMFSEATRHAAMAAARDDGTVHLSGGVRHVGDTGTATMGVVMYAPIYRKGTPSTTQARRDALKGWIVVPARVESLVAEALDATTQYKNVALTVHDVEDGMKRLLYWAPMQVPALGKPRVFSRSVMLDVYGRHWQLDFMGDAQASLDARTTELRVTFAAGVIASLLLFGIVLVLARTESLAELKAERLSESYRRSELRFRNAMRFSAIGMALLDGKGAIVDANAALAAIFDTTIDALVGSLFDGHFVDDHEQAIHARESVATTDGVYRTTRQWRQADGELRQVQLVYAPVPGEIGQDVASLVQVEDITERVRAQASERSLARTLETRVALRTRELTHANQELEVFAYSVSHDLRAPLRSIEGFSRLLGERYAGALGDDGKDYIARVRTAAGRMDALIDALLKMSRVSRGTLTRVPLDLSRMAGEIVAELRVAQPQRQVDVLIEPDLHAVGDAALIRTLLQNLIDNAWKFTRSTQGARIEVGRGEIADAHADDQPADDLSSFFVRDNGAGFVPEYADKLFRPFQRLHSPEDFDGHGIGLATVKRIVERHGGTVSAQGQAGEGATFRFTLPAEHDAAD